MHSLYGMLPPVESPLIEQKKFAVSLNAKWYSELVLNVVLASWESQSMGE